MAKKVMEEDIIIEVINLRTMEEEILEIPKGSEIDIIVNDLTEYFVHFSYNGNMYETSSYAF